MGKMCEEYPVIKFKLEEDDYWSDLVSIYKGHDNQAGHKMKVRLLDRPVVDTGGVRRQIFTQTLKDFAENKYVRMFEGPLNHLRPCYSAETRSSGLFGVLGKMVGHSIQHDGIGFPYLSPLCYDYIARGEQHAVQNCSLSDVTANVVEFITKVHDTNMFFCSYCAQ